MASLGERHAVFIGLYLILFVVYKTQPRADRVMSALGSRASNLLEVIIQGVLVAMIVESLRNDRLSLTLACSGFLLEHILQVLQCYRQGKRGHYVTSVIETLVIVDAMLQQEWRIAGLMTLGLMSHLVASFSNGNSFLGTVCLNP